MSERIPIRGDTGSGTSNDRIMDLVKEPNTEAYLEIKNVSRGKIPCDSLIEQINKGLAG